jgi:hypothetical protein
MIIEQTVEIPVSHRLTIEVPREVPAGRTILSFTPAPDEGRKADFAALAKRPGTEEMLAEAEKIWAWNRAHPQEVKEALRELQKNGPLFSGVDGVEFQRKIRDEWETDEA